MLYKKKDIRNYKHEYKKALKFIEKMLPNSEEYREEIERSFPELQKDNRREMLLNLIHFLRGWSYLPESERLALADLLERRGERLTLNDGIYIIVGDKILSNE